MFGFARTVLKINGYKSDARGYWEITEGGIRFFKEHQNNKKEGIYKLANLFKQRPRKASAENRYKRDSGDIPVKDSEKDDEDKKGILISEDEIYSSTYSSLESLGPYEFQKLTEYLFVGMGYNVSYNSPPGPDGGIDIIAHKDAIGVDGKVIKI